MIVLGIDPGVAIVGYGVVHAVKNRFSPLGYGVIRTRAGLPLEQRLMEIFSDLSTLIDTYKPDTSAVEELFFNTNQKTILSVGQARGVILLALVQKGVPIYEYTPLQVKQAVGGYGRAEKKQVMDMTRRLLCLDCNPKPDDAADALAIALCHAQSAGSAMFNK